MKLEDAISLYGEARYLISKAEQAGLRPPAAPITEQLTWLAKLLKALEKEWQAIEEL